jgi:antitoxin FitA
VSRDCNDYSAIIDDIGAATMASVTIRNLPDEVKDRLRVRAALNRRSLEAEIRETLVQLVSQTGEPTDMISRQNLGRLKMPKGRGVPYLDDPHGPKWVETNRAALYGDEDR